MAITFFNFASTPADNGTNTADPTAVTPPGSMLDGDLVFLIGRASATSGTVAISQAGGQSWNSLTQQNQTQCRTRCFWCRFNGTWGANPSVSFGATSNNGVVMLVFRPTQGSNTWSVDVAEVGGTYAAPSSPFTVTITGITTLTNGAVVIAAWGSADDNTWGSLTGGWTALSTAQFRNTSGSNDGSITAAYKVMATAGPSGNVAQNQATLGGDAGTTHIIAFKENTVNNWQQSVADAMSMGEVQPKGSGKGLPEAMVMGEQRAMAESSVRTEAMALGELVAKAVERLLADGMTMAEALGTVLGAAWNQAVVDAMGLGEGQTSGIGKANVDGLVLGEAIAEVMGKGLAETLGVGEVRGMGSSMGLTEAVALGEAGIRQSGKVVGEGLALGEFRGFAQMRGLAEAMGLGEWLGLDLGAAGQWTKAVADGIGLGEAWRSGVGKMAGDGLTLGEYLDAAIATGAALSKLIGEAILLGEEWSVVRGLINPELLEGLVLVDVVRIGLLRARAALGTGHAGAAVSGTGGRPEATRTGNAPVIVEG